MALMKIMDVAKAEGEELFLTIAGEKITVTESCGRSLGNSVHFKQRIKLSA